MLLINFGRQADESPYTTAADVMALLQACDAVRRPERMKLLLDACELRALAQGAQGYPAKPLMLRCLEAALSVNAAAVAGEAVRNGLRGAEIGAAVHEARRLAVGFAKLRGEGP